MITTSDATNMLKISLAKRLTLISKVLGHLKNIPFLSPNSDKCLPSKKAVCNFFQILTLSVLENHLSFLRCLCCVCHRRLRLKIQNSLCFVLSKLQIAVVVQIKSPGILAKLSPSSSIRYCIA